MNPSQTIADTYFPVNNGTYAFAPTLDTVRHHIFPTTPLWKQGFISRDKEEDSASKEFLAINHFDEFIKKDVMESLKSTTQSLKRFSQKRSKTPNSLQNAAAAGTNKRGRRRH